MLQLRPHQADAVKLAGDGQEVVTAMVSPGGGKTVMSLMWLDALYRTSQIDAAMVIVPRLALCSQYEMDWRALRPELPMGVMGDIVHKTNEDVSLSPSQFGWVTTYASLCANPHAHITQIQKYRGRIAIVLDEAHHVGVGNTRAAELIHCLETLFGRRLIMTGTLGRGDKSDVLWVDYDLDADGYGTPKMDIEVTYRDGVRDRYLRQFDARLTDGTIDTFSKGEIDLERVKSGLTHVVTDPDYWQPTCLTAHNHLRTLQQEHAEYCGVVGAANQEHARGVCAYLESVGASVVLAISDEPDAHANLRRFKGGGIDWLITVGMAHEGFDHKWVTVMVALTPTRQLGWLDQFCMRAGRVLPGIPYEKQMAYIYGTNDYWMQRYADEKRRDALSVMTYHGEKQERASAEGVTRSSSGPDYLGLFMDGINVIRSDFKDGRMQPEDVARPAGMTDAEWRASLRQEIKSLAGQFSFKKYKQVSGQTMRAVYSMLQGRAGGRSVSKLDGATLTKHIDFLKQLIANG